MRDTGVILGLSIIIFLILYNFFYLLFYKRAMGKRLQDGKTNASFFKEVNEDMKNKRTINRKRGFMYSLEKKLSQSLISTEVDKFLKNCILIYICSILLVYFATKSLMLSVLVLIGFPIIIAVILNYLKGKKIIMMTDQLLDSVNLICSSLKAGFSLIQSLNEVVKQGKEPIASEFRVVIEEIGIGKSYDEALNNLIERNSIEEIEIMATAIMINKKYGGNLSHILDVVSETLRERRRLKEQIRTLTAQGRLSGIILVLLPFVVGGIIFIINPTYINTLLSNTMGRILLITGLLGQIIGGLVIKSIINIDW